MSSMQANDKKCLVWSPHSRLRHGSGAEGDSGHCAVLSSERSGAYKKQAVQHKVGTW